MGVSQVCDLDIRRSVRFAGEAVVVAGKDNACCLIVSLRTPGAAPGRLDNQGDLVRHRLLEARRKDSGFTLIELLIVIVILGVLAAVVVLAVGAFDDRGEEAACKSDVKAVEVAVEAYRAKNGSYPGSLDDLVSNTDENYLRSLPNTSTSKDFAYHIEYIPGTGAVQGFLNKGTDTTDDDVDCLTGAVNTPAP
jgi:prepilin-type N-terminal cleavage/methylation domain